MTQIKSYKFCFLFCSSFCSGLNLHFSTSRLLAITMKRTHSDQLIDTESIKKLKSSNTLPFIPPDFIASRARLLTSAEKNNSLNKDGKFVVYWMSRDQRAEDNHAMHYAQVLVVLYLFAMSTYTNLNLSCIMTLMSTYNVLVGFIGVAETVNRSVQPGSQVSTSNPSTIWLYDNWFEGSRSFTKIQRHPISSDDGRSHLQYSSLC
jgi:hypothetical protein